MPSAASMTSGVSSFFELAENYERFTGELREIARGRARAEAERQFQELADRLLAPYQDAEMEKLAIWHSDYWYRLFNRLSLLDEASFAFLRPLGAAVQKKLRQRDRAVVYLIDNRVHPSRLAAAAAYFGALGFVFGSPETMAIELATGHGVQLEPDADELDPRLGQFMSEAIVVAVRLCQQAIEARSSVLFLSGECDLDVYRQMARTLRDTPLIGLFRNSAPDDGSDIELFNSSDGHREL
jgi:hypothetical protein